MSRTVYENSSGVLPVAARSSRSILISDTCSTIAPMKEQKSDTGSEHGTPRTQSLSLSQRPEVPASEAGAFSTSSVGRYRCKTPVIRSCVCERAIPSRGNVTKSGASSALRALRPSHDPTRWTSYTDARNNSYLWLWEARLWAQDPYRVLTTLGFPVLKGMRSTPESSSGPLPAAEPRAPSALPGLLFFPALFSIRNVNAMAGR